jgi:hypothetical protein
VQAPASIAPMRRRAGTIAAAAALVLVASVAADPGKEKVELTAADQAAARRVVLRSSDLGAGWTGGRIKPDLTSQVSCPTYHPKVSDLVVTGAAQSQFRGTGIVLANEVEIFRTAAMVERDWRRSIVPAAVPCLRATLTKGLGGQAKVLSFRRIPFPLVTRHTAAFRGIVAVSVLGQTVRVLIDVVLMGKGRTEISLDATAPAATARAVSTAERRLARILAARVRA